MFTKSSRYYPLRHRTWRAPDGHEVVYVERRLVPRVPPPTDRHTVIEPGERLDLVASRTLGRGELFWKLCDANGILDPFDPMESREAEQVGGRRLRVPEE